MQGDSTASEYITGATHEDLRRGERPLTPDEDPFYQPPIGYEQAQPGTVLRSRVVELGFLGVIRNTPPPPSCFTAPPTCTASPRSP